MDTVFSAFGNTDFFYEMGFDSSLEMPGYLKSVGLNGYEYSLEDGVHISDDSCEILKQECEKNQIELSVYSGKLFTSLSESVLIAKKTGAKRVIVPLGNCAVTSRKAVYNSALSEMKNALLNDCNIFLCPEIMGLIHDLGTLEEIIKLSGEDERFIPALNFPNLFARNNGKKLDCEDILNIFKTIEKKLGKEKLNNIHIYLSNVQYTNHGLKKYTDFSDKEGNDFDYKPVVNAVIKMKISPFIVCRSPYNCYNEAVEIKNYYNKEI